MPFAVKFEVTLPESTPEEDQKMLDEGIVPMAKAQAGFMNGVWMRKVSSPSEGVGVVVFATEQQAKDASEALRPPPEVVPPVVELEVVVPSLNPASW